MLVGALAFWAAAGANRGWTKNRVKVNSVDEVTGLTNIQWKDEFVPGVDFLAAAGVGAAILIAVSFAFQAKPKTTQHPT